MTEFQRGLHVCPNCGNPTKGKYEYQGVVCCSGCLSLALMCDRRAVKQCQDLLTVYRESLRTALVCGRLRPGKKIETKSGNPPSKDDLFNLARKLFKWREDLDQDIEKLEDEKETEEG